MTQRVPVEIFTDPRLEASDVVCLQTLFEELRTPFGKEAASPIPGGLSRELIDTALRGAASGAALFGTGLAAGGAVRGMSAMKDKLTRGSDLKKITDVYPELRDEDQREVNLAYDSLRHLNPHFAKDPLVGGTLLKQILRSREPGNPKAIRFEGSLAADLARHRPRETNMVEQLAVDSFTAGLQDAMRERRDRASALDEREWRQMTDKVKREADESFRVRQQKDMQAHQKAMQKLKERADDMAAAASHARAVDLHGRKTRDTANMEVLKARLRGTQEPEVLQTITSPMGTSHTGYAPQSPEGLASYLRTQSGPVPDLLK